MLPVTPEDWYAATGTFLMLSWIVSGVIAQRFSNNVAFGIFCVLLVFFGHLVF